MTENYMVAWLSEIVSLRLGIPPELSKQIGKAALLHDIGKIRINSSILNKPGHLTPEEFNIVKTHVEIGAEILSRIPGSFGKLAVTVARHHHEWANGAGYLGISTDRLPISVSIVAIADVYCALVHSRPYKEAWPQEQAFDYLQKQAGTQFSNSLVSDFISIVREHSRQRHLSQDRGDFL